MKTYRLAKDVMGKIVPTHVIVEVNGVATEVITEKKHPEKWAEYQASLSDTQPQAEASKKTRKKK
jgi:hypothetical protein